MRGEFEGISKEEARRKLGIADKYSRVILSFGGSLGAPMVNKASIEVMKNYTKDHPEVIQGICRGGSYRRSKHRSCSVYL